jgi:hypothetical protein
MPDEFKYDVFLSHSSKDKAVVRPIAERLKRDGLRVWLDDWEIRPGDNIPAKIEEGLEHSRVLVLCMSASAFGSDWAQLEASTFRFRDPLNKDRRFIPLRLDDASIKGSLGQYYHINWRPDENKQEYAKLLEACRSPVQGSAAQGADRAAPILRSTVAAIFTDLLTEADTMSHPESDAGIDRETSNNALLGAAGSPGDEVTRMSGKAPRRNKGNTAIFTGASGVKPKLVLENYNAFLKSTGKEPLHVIDFEERLVRSALRHPVCKGSKCFQQALKDQEPIIAVTSLPYPLLTTLWSDAMRSVCEEAVASTETGRNVAVVMHAVYFNTDSTALVPIVDPRAIEPIHPTCLVELVDDVYDVYEWLKAPGGVFDACSYPQIDFEQIQRSIEHLVATLVWRQAEAGATAHMAALLGNIPHFTVATKHRCRLLERILEGNAQRVYLSHPITEARSRAALGDLEFFTDWCKQVESLADLLSTELAVWEPTKIDELRFRQIEVTAPSQSQQRSEKIQLALPRLLPRWPFISAHNILWPAPAERTSDEKILDPAQLFTEEEIEKIIRAKTWEVIENGLSQERNAQLRSISGQLAHLLTLIGQQINARDRALVGQCPALVVYRPVFNGGMATGVLREIEAHQRLVELKHYTPGSRLAVFVLENSSDERLVWKRAVADFCSPEGRWSKYVLNVDGTPISSERAQEIGGAVTKDRLEPDHIVSMMGEASRAMRFAWSYKKRSALDGAGKGQAWADFVGERVRELQETIRERMRYKEVLLGYGRVTVSVFKDIDVMNFADEVKKGLTGGKG